MFAETNFEKHKYKYPLALMVYSGKCIDNTTTASKTDLWEF